MNYPKEFVQDAAAGEEKDLLDKYATTDLVPSLMVPKAHLSKSEPKKVEVVCVRAEHFTDVPSLKSPDRVTLLEEDMIQAFYAGGRLYAEPKRLGPIV